ncbi:hypothetical protein OAO31_03375 [Gammaproteobacteria bacterium]|nr:hypothetical protein [Gammaproteobacteria bacterium]
MKTEKSKQAIAFLSGSAGELDWILPILDYLSKLEFEIKIIYLTRHVQQSVSHNRLLSDYISQPNNQIKTFECGGYFVELIEKYGYLMHRINIKLKKPIFLSIFFYFFEKVCERVFKISLPEHIMTNNGEGTLIFSESPSLRRPRDKWIKQFFNKSIFFYCPHSPHIYSSDLDRKFPNSDQIDLNKKYFLLMGHPADYFEIDEENEYTSTDLEKVFTGHPKYSNQWLRKYKEKARLFQSSFAERKETNILVISRGYGSYIDEDSQKDLVEATVKVIDQQTINYNLFIKKHPRETDSHWDKITDIYPSISIVEDHILDIASKVDFAISFWSSGAMDCATLGLPVIEFYDPNKHSKQQILEGDTFTTIYRKLGVVYPANNEKELADIIARFLRENFDMQSAEPHSFYSDLMNRSNNWKTTLGEILAANGFMN